MYCPQLHLQCILLPTPPLNLLHLSFRSFVFVFSAGSTDQGMFFQWAVRAPACALCLCTVGCLLVSASPQTRACVGLRLGAALPAQDYVNFSTPLQCEASSLTHLTGVTSSPPTQSFLSFPIPMKNCLPTLGLQPQRGKPLSTLHLCIHAVVSASSFASDRDAPAPLPSQSSLDL